MNYDAAVGITELLYLTSFESFSSSYTSSDIAYYSPHYYVCSVKRTFILDRFDTFVLVILNIVFTL